MIEFLHVSKSYGSKVAVDNLSLTLPPGELFSLLGPNGAGKTTTIKLLVGLLRPSLGTVRICGHDVQRAGRAAAQCLGYVPDEPFLYEKLSGREFLEFCGEMRGLARADVARRIVRESDYFELGGFLDDLSETYSHGMKQRLVFASALLHDPQVLVIDEPMVGLDPRSSRLVKDRLRQQARDGSTVFMSTHTLPIVEEISDRLSIFFQGQMKFLGSLAQLQEELAAPGTALEPLFLQMTQGDELRAAG